MEHDSHQQPVTERYLLHEWVGQESRRNASGVLVGRLAIWG
jgi:hypothetical protein